MTVAVAVTKSGILSANWDAAAVASTCGDARQRRAIVFHSIGSSVNRAQG
jgi:hypothetical protein